MEEGSGGGRETALTSVHADMAYVTKKCTFHTLSIVHFGATLRMQYCVLAITSSQSLLPMHKKYCCLDSLVRRTPLLGVIMARLCIPWKDT